MSWLFSQALVEEYSQENSSDGEQFALLKEIDLPRAYCWRDKTTEPLSLFQFGMMSAPSTENLGADLLTWFREDFLAKTFPSREQCRDARALGVTGRVYGARCLELLGRFNQPMFSVKIRQNSGLKDSSKSSESYPASGIFVDGSPLELTLSDYLLSEDGYGSMLPTPTARDWKDTFGMNPVRPDGKSRLDRIPMLTFDHARSAGMSSKQMTNTDALTANMKGRVRIEILGPDYSPELSEWIMGWPIGWTDLRPLEMAKFQQWQLWHGRFFQENE